MPTRVRVALGYELLVRFALSASGRTRRKVKVFANTKRLLRNTVSTRVDIEVLGDINAVLAIGITLLDKDSTVPGLRGNETT